MFLQKNLYPGLQREEGALRWRRDWKKSSASNLSLCCLRTHRRTGTRRAGWRSSVEKQIQTHHPVTSWTVAPHTRRSTSFIADVISLWAVGVVKLHLSCGLYFTSSSFPHAVPCYYSWSGPFSLQCIDGLYFHSFTYEAYVVHWLLTESPRIHYFG